MPKSSIAFLLKRACIDRDYAESMALTYKAEAQLLAMMAADTPQFYNPFHAAQAKEVRDRYLSENDKGQPRAGKT